LRRPPGADALERAIRTFGPKPAGHDRTREDLVHARVALTGQLRVRARSALV
jgi:hypothetical protein